MKKKILPIGFRDVLSNEANLQLNYAKDIIRNFNKWGFNLIEPPLIEFESTLLKKNNDSLSDKSFKLLDPITKKTLLLRPDITSQLSRIASDRLSEFPKPLRLCYFGDVFRADIPKLSSDRQFKQAGIELIGSKNCYSDIEIIILSIETLKKIGFNKISLDLNYPSIINKIFEVYKMNNPSQKELKNLIAKRDIKSIKSKNKSFLKILSDLTNSTGSLKKNLSKIKKIKFLKSSKKEIKKFFAIADILLKKFNKYNFTVDLLERKGFEYHTGITFSVFCLKSNKEICRGGRYLTSNSENAVGSTFFLNQFANVSEEKDLNNKKILIPYGLVNDKNVYNLRKKGWVTIQNFSKKQDATTAKSYKCKFMLKNNKIKKVN